MALGDPLAYFSFSTMINRTLLEMIDSTLYDASDGCIAHQMQIPTSPLQGTGYEFRKKDCCFLFGMKLVWL